MSRPDGSKSSLKTSFACAFAGIASAAHERNFKIESAVGVVAIVLGFAFHVSLLEWLAIIVCIGVVLGLECLNTSLESLVDLASPGYNELARRAKDCAAGAVLVASIAALVVGIILFAPRILSVLGLMG